MISIDQAESHDSAIYEHQRAASERRLDKCSRFRL